MDITENELSKIVVNAAFKIHVALGPGLLESAYEACLIYELLCLRVHVLIGNTEPPKLEKATKLNIPVLITPSQI